MEIQLSVSAQKPKTYNMSAADTLAVAQELLPKLKRVAKDSVSENELKAHAAEVVSEWVKSTKTKFSPEARSKSAKSIANKMLVALKQSQRKPKVNTGDPKRDLATSPSGRVSSSEGQMSAAEITNVAQGLVDKMRKRHLPILSDNALRKAATEAVGRWVTHSNSSKLTKEVKQKAANKLIARVVALFTKGGAPKPKTSGSPASKLLADIVDSLLNGNKLAAPLLPTIRRLNDLTIGPVAEIKAAGFSSKKDAQAKADKLVGMLGAKGGAKKAPVKAPADKVVPTTKAATKEEKQKAQILAGTKLRNQFQGMLTTVPAMTGKTIENIRKHCDAYNRVITSVQKGNEALAETTKIEGLRGIDSVKNYVNSVLGLTYGYVELAKYLDVSQTILGEKISAAINMDTTNVERKRIAKANAQRNLGYVAKALTKRGCALPVSFQRAVEKVFVDAATSEDYKAAKASIRELISNLVTDVFSNKVKLYQAK